MTKPSAQKLQVNNCPLCGGLVHILSWNFAIEGRTMTLMCEGCKTLFVLVDTEKPEKVKYPSIEYAIDFFNNRTP